MSHRPYTRRDVLRALGAGAATVALPGCAALRRRDLVEPQGPSPNIVYILADDLGYGDLRCLNPDSKVPTPNMDRLASAGICFTDAHSPSAVCTPTRYGILTGRYCWRTRLKSGVLWNGYARALIDPGRETVASLLRKHGYHTGCVGKWHLGFDWASTDGAPVTANNHDNVDFGRPVTRGPGDLGFDYSCIVPASLDMDPYCWIENHRAVEIPTVKDPGSKRVWSGGKGFWRTGLRSPSFQFNEVLPTIAKKSVDYIGERAADGKPFFLYVPLASPHTPWVPNESFRGKSHAGIYGDFVHETDWAVGRILDALDRHGLTQNTLVIMTSDNGSHWPVKQIEQYDHRANHIYRGQKADIWDGGHRIPFIARWPGRTPPGTVCDDTICLTDLIATSAAIVRTRLPDDTGEDSASLLSHLLGKKVGPIHEAVVHHSLQGVFAIRQGKWKLILGRGSGGFTEPAKIEPREGAPIGQLYNLADDPGEATNVYARHPDVVQRLTKLLEQYIEQGHSRPARG
ncbi:MAG: sulfatase-like hydrolase/transferase [Phycisphaerales bacterium]|nr:sulfatase-like hydrolase/transferase [Phycisphaerales bacterium]